MPLVSGTPPLSYPIVNHWNADIAIASPMGRVVGDSTFVPAADSSPRTLERVAVVLLQLGVVLVALVALPFKAFELDRYFVPKELVLSVAAVLLLAWLLVRARTPMVDFADLLLAGFLALSSASTLLATNHWLAQRALGVSFAGAVVFWSARRLGFAGWSRALLLASAIATACAAASALAQAYGLDIDYFSLNRAPGGTFGNRNFLAHFAAIGLPALLYATFTARRSFGMWAASLGAAMVAVALVLSRSRAAWLAAAASFGVFTIAIVWARPYWGGRALSRPYLRFLATAALGAAVAIVLPNRLNWRSDSPYLDSARALVDYSSGSGRGRVSQYRNSLRMAASHPVLGVGPGNWPVHYPSFAPGSDASLTDDGMTANPWPSSDWVAFVSERGLLATSALLGVFAALFLGGWLRWRELDPDSVLARATLLGTLVATLVAGMFDAVLLLPAPAFLAWCVIGASSGPGRRGRRIDLTPRARRVIVGATLLVMLGAALRSIAQTTAIAKVGSGNSRSGWIEAAAWDPGSYRIQLRAAEVSVSQGRCASARAYARRALSLFPRAAAARRIVQRCG